MFPIQEFTCTCASVCIVAPYNMSHNVVVCAIPLPINDSQTKCSSVITLCVPFIVTGPPSSLSFTVNPGMGNIIVAVTQVSNTYCIVYTCTWCCTVLTHLTVHVQYMYIFL